MAGRLRPFDPDSDAVHVAELWRTSLEPIWPLLPAAIASQRQGLISMAGDEVTGFVGFDPAGSIPLILVHPAWQRRGVGGALMTAALDALRSCGAGAVSAASGGEFTIWPGVPRDLPAAVSFFGSHGWRRAEDTLDLVANLDGYQAPRGLTGHAPVTLSVLKGPQRQHVLDFEETNFPSWTRWFRDERQDILLARGGDGRTAGTLLFAGPGAGSVFAPMLGPAAGTIGCVGVAPEWQDRGIGTAMVVRASELLRDAGTNLCHIGWAVRESFYVRAGYSPWRRYAMFRLDLDPRRQLMTALLSSPLRDQKLAPAAAGLALAEWNAPAAAPGPPSYQAPLHVHHDDDEAWYVLQGRLVVRIGDTDYDVPAGAAVIGPHGLPHTFWNPDPVPARYVLVMSARTSALLDALHGGAGPQDMRQLFAEHGCELLG